MGVDWLEQPMFCGCYLEVTATVVTVLSFYHFLRREVMFGTCQRKGLWPPTSISVCPVGCNSFSAPTGQQENSIKRVCSASIIPQMPHGTWGGMRWHDLRAENKSQRWDLASPSPVCSRRKGSLMLNQSPRSALSPDREKDELVLPKHFSWDTSMKNVRLVRTKTFYLGKNVWETVVPGHSTTVSFILTNFMFSSGRIDFGQNQEKPSFIACSAMCQMKSLTRLVLSDIIVR